MNKLFIALSIFLTTSALPAADMMQMQSAPQMAPQTTEQTNQPPATTQQAPQLQTPTMKDEVKEKLTKEYIIDFKDKAKPSTRQIQLQVDIAEGDIKDYGLDQSAVMHELSTRLSLAQIQIKDDPAFPKLVLRIKSIQADRAVATFVQLGFFEDSMLIRNKSSIPALTWSQATLISGPKEEMTKEVTQIIVSMINSFIMDYNKAMSA